MRRLEQFRQHPAKPKLTAAVNTKTARSASSPDQLDPEAAVGAGSGRQQQGPGEFEESDA
jgi:hypothetical protein